MNILNSKIFDSLINIFENRPLPIVTDYYTSFIISFASAANDEILQ